MNGRIGQTVVESAVKKCFIHCLIRSAPKIALNSIFFKIIDGDATNNEELEEALEGKDAVISAFGVPNDANDHAITDFSQKLIEAMKKKVRILEFRGSKNWSLSEVLAV